MNKQYYNVLTEVGTAKLTNSTLMGDTLKLTTVKVGDGGAEEGKETFPNEAATALVRERWSGNITNLSIDPENKNWVVAEAVIPVDAGGFYITEFGLYDDQGDLICIGKYPKTYKPKVQQNSGSASSLYLKVVLEVSNAKNIELKIDPAIVLASREYVDRVYKEQLSSLPFPPEIVGGDNRLKVTIKNNENKLVVQKDQSIRWRGWKEFNTADYDKKEQRTFNYEPEETYHLRWSPTDAFKLYDVTDNTYNPNNLSEYDQIFDTSYDDVLMGKLEKGEFYPAIVAAKRVYRYKLNGDGVIKLPLGYLDKSFRMLVTVRDIVTANKNHIQINGVTGRCGYFLLDEDHTTITPRVEKSFYISSANALNEVSITTVHGDVCGNELYLQSHQSEYSNSADEASEELLAMGVKQLNSIELKEGLPLNYFDVKNATIVFEVF
ncbi:phage tail protein [Endozoicomonas sp. SM1973]|uniref:Phage tail protein n=1 Tax=Spartinivicinus marinus TaxID=2994442 RepID=A0A853I1G7_9GAMM|nr:phage tail protein [Spartinivicinus marinus]MCX4026402.1 phage tail protein [Spartinivicinus marinus]NYZ67253.1 phage tail protein [Spartinivicinus marinus]